LGFSKDENEGDYWKNQLPFHQKNIENAKIEAQKTIEKLAKNGVNVAEIQTQMKLMEDKISELDQKLTSLPETEKNLCSIYKSEKEEKQKTGFSTDFIVDRAEENRGFFRINEKNLAERENSGRKR
jgi:predicted transcriptional regulator